MISAAAEAANTAKTGPGGSAGGAAVKEELQDEEKTTGAASTVGSKRKAVGAETAVDAASALMALAGNEKVVADEVKPPAAKKARVKAGGAKGEEYSNIPQSACPRNASAHLCIVHTLRTH